MHHIHVTGAGAILACAFTHGWLQRLLAILSKFGVAMAYNLSYIYTEEMFPTTVRNTALVRRCFWPGSARSGIVFLGTAPANCH